MDPIAICRKSGNKVLQTEAKDFSTWSKLRHNKQDLGLLLRYNIAEVIYTPRDSNKPQSIFCTSNKFFIDFLNKSQKAAIEMSKKGISIGYGGYKENKDNSVLTYDIIDGRPKTINLNKDWYVKNMISITQENVEVLREVLSKVLK